MLIPLYWRGKGLWVSHLLLAVLVIVILIDKVLDPYLALGLHQKIAASIGFARFIGILLLLLPGLPMVALGWHAALKAEAQPVFEPETGRVRAERGMHSLYGINAWVWGAAWSALGLLLLVRN